MQDLQQAVRFLWSHKAFTATAVLTLAIGLGANTTLFGLFNAVLRPMDVPAAEEIVAIAADTKGDETGGFQFAFSIEALKDLQRRADAFSDVFGVLPRIAGLSADGRVSQFWFSAVSDNYFPALRVTPHLGTLVTSASGSPVRVVLGHSFWMRTFAGDPTVIGRHVRVEGQPAVISGVVPRSFRGTFMAVEIDGYVALDDYGVLMPDVTRWLYNNRKAKALHVFGRLKPEVSLSEAQARMDVLMATLGTEHPATDAGVGARVIPEPLARPLPMRAVTDTLPRVRLLALAIAALVLLIACMNVANLLLVRSSARQREMAVRAALGASRLRLIRQMVTEGLVLAVLGGVAGLALGQLVLALFVARLDIGADMPLHVDATFDGRVFAYAATAATATGLLIGLWPAWRASRADARAALHDGGKGLSDSADRQRLRRVLVVGQIAGSLALLIVAGLFVRSLLSAQRINLGFDAAHLVTARLDPRQIGYDEDRTNEFYRELRRRVAAWPEVASAAIAFSTPMSHLIAGGSIYIEGRDVPASTQPPASFINRVGHGYFDTMRIPILRGRAFVEDDERATSKTRAIAIVNETMAAKYWPGEDPIGKRLRVYAPEEPWLEIVGVAADSKYVLIFEEPRPFLYLPMERDLSLRTLHVRAHGSPAPLLPRLEREIRALAAEMPIADLRTMEESLSGAFGFLIFRIGAIQAAGMGGLGLLLAVIGVYGVVSFGASLRTREIGIRVALGAAPRDVRRMILAQGIQLAGAGIVLGIASAWALGRVLARLVPLVDAADWVTFATVSTGLAVLVLWACYVPARRASRVPVMHALRHE